MGLGTGRKIQEGVVSIQDRALEFYERAQVSAKPEYLLAAEFARAELLKAAEIAANPYGDEVEAYATDQPGAVGIKIAAAIRELGE